MLEWNGRSLQGKSAEDVYDIIAESKQDVQVELVVSRAVASPAARRVPHSAWRSHKGKQTDRSSATWYSNRLPSLEVIHTLYYFLQRGTKTDYPRWRSIKNSLLHNKTFRNVRVVQQHSVCTTYY